MILQRTDNVGVDVPLNSLTEEKLQSSLRRFLEIEKFDFASNNQLSTKIFMKDIINVCYFYIFYLYYFILFYMFKYLIILGLCFCINNINYILQYMLYVVVLGGLEGFSLELHKVWLSTQENQIMEIIWLLVDTELNTIFEELYNISKFNYNSYNYYKNYINTCWNGIIKLKNCYLQNFAFRYGDKFRLRRTHFHEKFNTIHSDIF
ncbi:LOW QUALITY PROTEIN: fatty acid synthase-like isoform X2 [Vespula maculifrons]|uniref:Fatty acid synthase-like isoform X2 n=1 Tax=Vespula maculifrons TaxID=7453 RepID=A0ABD2CT85_VESMC